MQTKLRNCLLQLQVLVIKMQIASTFTMLVANFVK